MTTQASVEQATAPTSYPTPEELEHRRAIAKARNEKSIIVKLDDAERRRTGVRSYFFFKREDNIIELFVNTDPRWMRMHRMSDEWLELNPIDSLSEGLGEILVLDPRLVEMERDGITRCQYTMHDCDQSHMLSIPLEFLRRV